MHNIADIREQLLNAETFNEAILAFIHKENWLRIWVPKSCSGLGLSFSEGLIKLQEIAKIDGSLGWMVTLCSGANYFTRNLQPSIAKELFSSPITCFGGSGMLGGTAEKKGDYYVINGLWHYATGAPYLTHFTLNAKIVKEGKEVLDENKEPLFLSFVLHRNQVKLIPTWQSMGMIATSSHSFEVNNEPVHQDYSFVYNHFYTDDLVEKVPFRVFADLTLLVNYIGMAEHFLEESASFFWTKEQQKFEKYLKNITLKTIEFSELVENVLMIGEEVSEKLTGEIHTFGEDVVERITQFILFIYPKTGIRGSKINEQINQIFRDYFTATQHRNFRKQFSCL